MISAPVLLGPAYELNHFDCGEPSLNAWLLRRALANQATGATRTFVLCDDGKVIGYYALATGAVTTTQASGRFRRNMPDPIPVVILARLAIATAQHGRGLGRALFRDAARRVIVASDSVGIRGLLVHALSDAARQFYLDLGLAPPPLDPMTLMATTADLRVAAADQRSS